MVLECLRARTGIRFSNDALVEMGLDPSTFVPKFPAYPSVTAKDDEDCESSINDELEKHPAWWVIELLPMRVPEKNQKGVLEQWPR
ncbi:hypothetical protein AN958_10001 [Leucoagaricus sp. SymC.cos]|nr:hypothetical protein AN958_10001 [Leucoagaricus sp. SymC.cos]